MSYLRNKELRQQRMFRIAAIILVLAIIFLFRGPIGSGFSAFAHGIAWPFLKAKQGIGTGLSRLGTDFRSKQSLADENAALKEEFAAARLANLEHDVLLADNTALREALGRSQSASDRVAAVILAKPNASPYDTLVIDIGSEDGIMKGALVYAAATVPIGTIDELYGKSARVRLFSMPKEVTKVVAPGGLYIDMTGAGGGNFKATLPRGIAIKEGDTLTLPNIDPHVAAVIQKIVSDPRDPFQMVLAKSPVNIQELKFVEVAR